MTCALRSGKLDGYVAIGPLRCRMQNRAGQGSWTGTNLDDAEVIGLAESIKLGIDPAREYGTKQRPNFRRGNEIATPTSTTRDRIETVLAVQRFLEVLVEAQSLVQGPTPARSVIAPTLAIRPGNTPNTSVATAQITSAACTEP